MLMEECIDKNMIYHFSDSVSGKKAASTNLCRGKFVFVELRLQI